MPGAGYLLPSWSISCLYKQALVTPFLFLEDVFITGILGKKCKVPMLSRKEFSPKGNQSMCNIKNNRSTEVLEHSVRGEKMIRLHEIALGRPKRYWC